MRGQRLPIRGRPGGAGGGGGRPGPPASREGLGPPTLGVVLDAPPEGARRGGWAVPQLQVWGCSGEPVQEAVEVEEGGGGTTATAAWPGGRPGGGQGGGGRPSRRPAGTRPVPARRAGRAGRGCGRAGRGAGRRARPARAGRGPPPHLDAIASSGGEEREARHSAFLLLLKKKAIPGLTGLPAAHRARFRGLELPGRACGDGAGPPGRPQTAPPPPPPLPAR